MTTAVQNIQRVVKRWMYWDLRRISTPSSVPLTVTLPFQHSGCQLKPQGSGGGQESGRGRSALIPTLHGNNLQGLTIMNIELERIWLDLGIGRLLGHFDRLGSAPRVAVCSCRLFLSDVRTHSLYVRLKTTSSGGCFTASVFGFCSRTGMQRWSCVLSQQKKSHGLRGWRHLMLLTPCLPLFLP